MESTQIGKEEVKLFTVEMVIYVESPKESIKDSTKTSK